MAQPNQLETPADREARIAAERAMLDEARASYKAGRYLGGEALDEWLAAFFGGADLPSPDALRQKYAAAKSTDGN
jgi:predicted aminopeptidase